MDDPIPWTPGNAIQSHARAAQEGGWTRRKMLEMFSLGSRYPVFTGDAATVADEMQAWVAETGIDGFNLTRTVVPECHAAFVDLVVPELQQRGAYKTAYEDGTLRRKLHGEADRLPARHAAAAFRRAPA
jgi:alkanesulfonate monooxygenase SsuD/methylene tetrahydromethanopterin reductase-like flavin-dependent oxidoreductase (luciferase family)